MHPLAHRTLMSAMVPLRCRFARRMQGRENWPLERIRAYQERKLRKVIAYCWKHVPLYQDKWKGVIDGPEDIQSIADLQKLPLLTKQEVREQRDAMRSRAPWARGNEARTGGSTGEPIIFRLSRFDEELSWAQMYVGWFRAGYRIGDPILAIGGESIGVGLGDRRSWKDWVLNKRASSSSNLTRERVETLVQSPHFHQAKLMFGYPNGIRELCEHLADLNVRPRSLVGVICTAEVMLPEVRQRIVEVLGTPRVLDQYGLNDGGLHACEGPEMDGLHLSFHRGVLEILDTENRQINELGQPGRAVATTLTNFATPFIRYETGDHVHWQSFEPSASGITWPRLGPIDGRTGDLIYMSNGRTIAMPGLTLVMRWMEGLARYQFIQTGPDAVTARLLKGPGFAMSEDQVIAFLRERIAGEIDWTIEWGAPSMTRNGKLLVLRNDWLRGQGLTRPPGR